MPFNEERIFSWKDFPTWEDHVEGVLPPGIIGPLADELKRPENLFENEDDHGQFKGIYSRFADYNDLIRSVIDGFAGNFTHVKVYHAGRPEDPEDYVRDGINVLDCGKANRYFRKLFLNNPRFPSITEHLILSAEAAGQVDQRQGRVYFALDDRVLTRRAYHYLLFGSEYIQGLVTHLEMKTGLPLKSILTETGSPTIVTVKLPVNDFLQEDRSSLEGLAKDLVQNWARKQADVGCDIYLLDFGTELEVSVGPEYVIGRYRPDVIDHFGMMN